MPQHAVLFVADGSPDDTAPVLALRDRLDASVATAASGAAARRALAEDLPDCVVTDYELPDETGLDLLEHVRSERPDAGCILFTGVDRDAIDTAAFGDVLPEYVDSDLPDAVDRLVDLTRNALEARSHAGYPLPDDEHGRLETLAGLDLDSAPLQAALDRLTALAAEHFDVPMASVNVVFSHSQDCLVAHGADWSPLPREDTVCTYTILDDDITVIEDLRDDVRFADNDALADMGIRFYAGAPLRVGEAAPVGTLCLYDDKPRSFPEADRESLRRFTAEVVDQFALRARRRSTDRDGDAARTGDR